jgi:hypothetical protein
MKIKPNRLAFGPPIRAAATTSHPLVDLVEAPRLPAGMVGSVFTRVEQKAVRRIQVRGRAGIWEVLRDDRFFGHYMGYQAALDAAKAAAEAIVAGGGAADVRFKQGRSQPGVAEPTGGPGFAPIGTIRTMEFRAGAEPVVR